MLRSRFKPVCNIPARRKTAQNTVDNKVLLKDANVDNVLQNKACGSKRTLDAENIAPSYEVTTTTENFKNFSYCSEMYTQNCVTARSEPTKNLSDKLFTLSEFLSSGSKVDNIENTEQTYSSVAADMTENITLESSDYCTPLQPVTFKGTLTSIIEPETTENLENIPESLTFHTLEPVNFQNSFDSKTTKDLLSSLELPTLSPLKPVSFDNTSSLTPRSGTIKNLASSQGWPTFSLSEPAGFENTQTSADGTETTENHTTSRESAVSEVLKNVAEIFSYPDYLSTPTHEITWETPPLPTAPEDSAISSNSVNLKSVLHVGFSKKTSKSIVNDETDNTLISDAPFESAEVLGVPQIEVRPDGQVIINEKSLEIARKRSKVDRSKVIVENETVTGEFAYKKTKPGPAWNKWDTFKFYKALKTYGTNFSLMQSVFPDRTRRSLKNKFKREEKLHLDLVDKVLREQVFDEDGLKDYFKIVDEKNIESKKKITTRPNPTLNESKNVRCYSVMNEVECVPEKNSSGDNDVQGSRITITSNIKPVLKKPKIEEQVPKTTKKNVKERPTKKKSKAPKKEKPKCIFTCYL